MGDRSVSDLTLEGSSRRTSARRVGIAAFFDPRSLRGVIPALPRANFLAVGFTIGAGRLAGLVEICISPLLAGLSEFSRLAARHLRMNSRRFSGSLWGTDPRGGR
jgi:hypothetical protein